MASATLVLNAYSNAYPSIVNRIRASVFAENDPSAIIQQIIDSTSGHPARTWSFPGLPRNNYGLSFDEIDGSGNVLLNIALFDIVPGEVDGYLTRDDEQIQGGVTTGFGAGLQTWTFDGTVGSPNYIGWKIVPSELTGRGILVEGLDYSWVPSTGVFTLLQIGDKLPQNQWYNIHFDPITSSEGASYPTVTDFQIVLLTVNTVMDNTYAGKKIICEPTSVYNEHTLPDIDTVPDGRKIMLETSKHIAGEPFCVKILPFGSQTINFLYGNIYMCSNESLSVYRFTRPDTTKEWRVCDEYGNFRTVGDNVSTAHSYSAINFNRVFANGQILSTIAFARLYNDFVLNLPTGAVITAVQWLARKAAQGFTTQYSLDDGTGNFYVPDTRALYERGFNDAQETVSGLYERDGVGTFMSTVKARPTIAKAGTSNKIVALDTINDPNLGNIDVPNVQIVGDSPTGFTQPRNYSATKYILV